MTCGRAVWLSMNRVAVTPTFQSARLAGWKPGTTKLNGFMGPMRGEHPSRLPVNRHTFGASDDLDNTPTRCALARPRISFPRILDRNFLAVLLSNCQRPRQRA